MHATTKDSSGGNGAGAALRARLRAFPKRYIVLIALVPVLVVLWLPLVTGKPGKGASTPVAATTTPDNPPAAPGAETASPPTSTSIVASAAALQARLQTLVAPSNPRWTPTDDQQPFRTASNKTAETVVREDAQLTPTAIVLSDTQAPIAIIGGKNYRPGDSLEGRSIVAIEERRVLYRHGTKTYAVSLPEPTLRGDHD